MKKAGIFSDVVEAAGNLPLDAREELVEILQKRAAEERRAELVRDVRAAREEHRQGVTRRSTAAGIMKEILG